MASPQPQLKKQATFSTRGAGDEKAKELAQMGGAIEAQPTVEMRADLEAQGVEKLDDEALTKLSHQFTKWIEGYRYREGHDETHSVFNLFAVLDQDGSKFITFDELTQAVRTRLHVKHKALADDTLKALWCELDADNSNKVLIDEMAGFLKRAQRDKAAALKKQPSMFSTRGAGEEKAKELAKLSEALACTPTSQMRAELEAAGIRLPDDNELTKLSHQFTKWIEDYRYNKGMPKATTWFNLYKELDEDGSNFVTYDEMLDFLRHKLKVGSRSLSKSSLKALWCVLDADDSNQVQKDELSTFFRRSMPDKPRRNPSSPNLARPPVRSGSTVKRTESIGNMQIATPAKLQNKSDAVSSTMPTTQYADAGLESSSPIQRHHAPYDKTEQTRLWLQERKAALQRLREQRPKVAPVGGAIPSTPSETRLRLTQEGRISRTRHRIYLAQYNAKVRSV